MRLSVTAAIKLSSFNGPKARILKANLSWTRRNRTRVVQNFFSVLYFPFLH